LTPAFVGVDLDYVTIRGNVMVCDECGRQVSMPMGQKDGGKQSLDERVRSYAAELSWRRFEGEDSCPDHQEEAEITGRTCHPPDRSHTIERAATGK
jgi:hypothetical protein